MIGTEPYRFIPAEYGKQVVVSAFEPLDILESTAMILRQRAEGRCELENQYTRVVRPEGNPRAIEAIDETMELARDVRVARARARSRGARCKLRPAFADWDAEVRFDLPGVRGRRSEGVPVRRGARRRDQAVGVQGLRDGLHAGAPARDLHGLERGRVRRLLQLRPPPRRVTKLRDELITLAHGSGGKATHMLVEELFLEELRNPLLDELGDAAQSRTGSRSRPTRSSSSRSSSRAATSASSPSTARSTTSPSRAPSRSGSPPAS